MTTSTKDLPMTSTTVARHHRVLSASVLTVLAALLVLVPGVAHAAGSSDGVPPGKAWVRVGHFVPGMGATSIELDPIGSTADPITLAGSATYGQVSAYEKLAPGSYTVTVRESDAAAGSAPVLSRSFEVAANDARTVAVVGTASAPRLALLSDDLTPPQAGTARVRLLSAAGADPVTVTAVDGPTIASDAVLGQATDYATVPAGSWTLQLTAATANATLQDVAVTSGSIYTVVVLDDSDQVTDENGDQDVKLDVVTDAAGAVVAPKGGAHTGLGGTAPAADADAGHLTAWPLGALTALVTALAYGVLRRRRAVPVRIG